LPYLICPSDSGLAGGGEDGPIGFKNYRFCVGTTICGNDFTGNGGPQSGVFGGYPQQYGLSDILDGTSNTIAIAERCGGNVANTRDILGNVAQVAGFTTPDTYPTTSNPGVIACAASTIGFNYLPTVTIPEVTTGAWYPGSRWGDGRPYYSTVNTVLPPNGPSCTQNFDGGWSLMTPTSRHTGVVQVVLADGSVRAISQNISLLTWQGLGTRSGGEVVGAF
jgi:hypothetical protein